MNSSRTLKNIDVQTLGILLAMFLFAMIFWNSLLIYPIKLFAADTSADAGGKPNSGLVDTTYVRVPHDMSGKPKDDKPKKKKKSKKKKSKKNK